MGGYYVHEIGNVKPPYRDDRVATSDGPFQLQTTMLYVQLAPQDVWREYTRALQKRKGLDASHLS